jgi:hypothetical protein
MKHTELPITLALIMLCAASTFADDQNTGVVSKTATPEEQQFVWTLEKMLMATPMPMTGEERQFLQTHGTLDGIRSWTLAKFKEYADSDLGRKHITEEAMHWRGNVEMLRKQRKAGDEVLGKHVDATTSRPSTLTDKQGSTPNNLDSASLEEIQAMLNKDGVPQVFEQMKSWRQEIADLAPIVEAQRKEAESKGLSEKLERLSGD